MQTDIATVIDGLPELPEPLTYYHELDPNGYWSVTSDTFIGLVYTEAGLVNIADAVGDGQSLPAAERRVHRVRGSGPDLPRVHEVLRRDARDGRRPRRLGRR